MKDEIRRLGIPLPFELPSGCFRNVIWCPNVIIYGFIYDTTAGCRDTSSTCHKQICQTTVDLIEPSDLIEENNLLTNFNPVGKYLFPSIRFDYVPSPNGVCIAASTHFEKQSLANPFLCRKRLTTETERTAILLDELKKVPYVKHNNIHLSLSTEFFKEMRLDVCPFTGGGDIFINKDVLSNHTGVCLFRELDDTDFDSSRPDSPTSDPSQSFRRPSIIECKVGSSSSQSPHEIELELKANMMLVLCHQFYNVLANTIDSDSDGTSMRLKDITTLTAYGMTLGSSTDLDVLKLQLNFKDNTFLYTRRFRYPQCPAIGHFSNGALSYIIRRISKYKQK